ncbi:hypothetical protein B7494_g2748 [Chlorociboria aeruginascens]|nr:hypothetical protein B7494_g2748 [Chlorociboria aeruginascens]
MSTRATLDICANKAHEQLQASIYYLRRLELYKLEKPYMLTFDPSGLGGERTNHDFIRTTVKLHNAQSCRENFNLDVHGFAIREWPTGLDSSDFDDDEIIKQKYYPEIISRLKILRPDAKEILVLNHLRRKRPLKFTQRITEEPAFEGPVVYAHTDFTPRGAAIALTRFLDRQESPMSERRDDLLSRCYEFLKQVVWRVTKGPNQDWPLAVCDYTSVDCGADLEATDIVHKEWVGESGRVYHNPKHKWYFLDQQQAQDVIVFRNTDSRGFDIPYAPHVAFETGCERTSPRESIEIRATDVDFVNL